MRNIIKHKRISAVTILMILVIVFAVSTKKSVGGFTMAEMVIAFAPFGIVGKNEYFELTALNNYCNDTLNVKITGFNANDGTEVGTLTGDFALGESAIKSFLKASGSSTRRNIYVEVELSCPKGAVLKQFKSVFVPSEFPIRLEIVDQITNSTIERIEPSAVKLENEGSGN